jgi:ribosome-binding protein aMBF1 (putative translation factor)
MTQKELATAINEKPQVVAEYESGKAIPNPQIILKLERSLGVKLPRSGKPKVAVAKSSVSSTTTSGGAAKKPGVPSVGKINALTRGGPAKRR